LRTESERDCEIEKGVYGLEITTTQACNFQCSYCFERNHQPEEQLLDARLIIKRVNQLLEAEWFRKQYSGIKLILWGGEPTMNMPLCKTLMEAFRKNERIAFFLYTNGSTIDNLMPTLRRLKEQPFVKEGMSKVTIQVSYDGNPLHDLNRKDRCGETTSRIVLSCY
jgi:sulfatase maturation enzyme AslB (radical SAM superfamily)